MRWFKTKNTAAKSAPAAVEVRFVMPGFSAEGFNVLAADTLLNTPSNSALLQQISLAVGGKQELFTDFLLPAIRRCAYTVQLLAAAAPDSPTAHHTYAGGLLRHLLETMLFCINDGRSLYINTDVLPNKRESHREAFILCCALIGLTHDLGKIFDQEVVTYTLDGTELPWDPFEPLPEFLSRVHGIPMEHVFDRNGPRYDVKKWIPKRGGKHALYSNFLLRSFIPKKFLSYVQNVNPHLVREFMSACVWSLLDKGFYPSEDNRLSRCLRYADAASCALDAKNSKKPLTVNFKTPEIYEGICKILRRFILDGSLLINKTRGDSLLFSSGSTPGDPAASGSEQTSGFKLFLRFDRIFEFLLLNKIRQHILSDLRFDLFRDQEPTLAVLRDFLTELGLIEPYRYVITPGALLLLPATDPFLIAHPELCSNDPKNCEAIAFSRSSDLINDKDLPGNNPEYLKGLQQHRCTVVSALPTRTAHEEPVSEDTYLFTSEGLTDPDCSPSPEPAATECAATAPLPAAEFSLTPQVVAAVAAAPQSPASVPAALPPSDSAMTQNPAKTENNDVKPVTPAANELISSLLKNIGASAASETPVTAAVSTKETEYREQQKILPHRGFKLLEETVPINRRTALSDLLQDYQPGRSSSVFVPELSCTIDLAPLINQNPRGCGEILAQFYLSTLPDKVKSTLNRLIYPALDAHPRCPLELKSYDGANCVAAIRYDGDTQKQTLKKTVRILREHHLVANSDDNFDHEINFFKSVQLIRPFAFILLCGGCAISNGEYLTAPFSRPPNKPTTKDIFLFFKYRLLMLKPGDKLYGCTVHGADAGAAVRCISTDAVTRCAAECGVQLRSFNSLLQPSAQQTPPVMIRQEDTLLVYPYLPQTIGTGEFIHEI